jgi:steroid delta-isomerase-like uncharacterized protein
MTNKEIISAFVNATNHHDWEKAQALVHPDFVRHSTGAQEINSREKLIAFHQAELNSFPDMEETILLLIEEGEYGAARMHFKGTQTGYLGSFPPSNKTLEADFICIFRVVQGQITESWVEYDNLYGLKRWDISKQHL